MNKHLVQLTKGILSISIVFVAGNVWAAKTKGGQVNGIGFVAPNVNDKDNVGTPETGAIVFDTNDATFQGNAGTPAAPSWVTLGGAALPPGTILPYVGTTAPAGFLLCNGDSHLRSSYPALATALACASSTCAFGAADSTHFTAPDLRGQFLRGFDDGAGTDPDAAGRSAVTGGNSGDNVGSVQSSAVADHQHSGVLVTNGSHVSDAGAGTLFGVNSTPTTSGNVSGATTSTETRPVNVSVTYIIKY